MTNVKTSVYSFLREIKKMFEQTTTSQNINSNIVTKKDKTVHFSVYIQVLIFLVGLLGLTIAATAFSFMFSSLSGTESFTSVVTYSAYITIFVVLMCTALIERKEFVSKFKNPKDYGIGFLMGIVLIFATALLSMTISSFAPISDNQNQVAVESTISFNPLMAILVLGIIGPICEEMTYRVGLFSFISRKSKVLAYIIVPIVFGFIHFDFGNITSLNEWLNLPIYVLSGLILTFTYERFGPAASMTAHITNNVFSIVVNLIQ